MCVCVFVCMCVCVLRVRLLEILFIESLWRGSGGGGAYFSLFNFIDLVAVLLWR